MSAWMRLRIICGLMLAAWHAGVADRFVWKDSPSPGSGYTDWTVAATSLHDAVGVVSAGETIWVSNGTYDLTSEIVVNDFKVIGVGPELVFVNADNYAGKPLTNRCFYLNHNNALVAGCTISNGNPSGNYGLGGGVYLNKGILSNCYVRDNISTGIFDSRGGGGVYINDGTATHCRIYNNLATNGGGVSIASGMMAHCLVSNNHAQANGGGIQQCYSPQIIQCQILCNDSQGEGGGIYLNHSPVIQNCEIAGNHANKGGGISVRCNAPTTINNCQINSNTAAADGGGAYLRSTALNAVLNKCELRGNTAIANGGGAYIYTLSPTGRLENCVLAGNTAFEGGGAYLYSCGQMRNCLVFGNSATSSVSGGGGILALKPADLNGFIDSCTIVSNAAVLRGGGLYASGTNQAVTNCIIYYNTAASSADIYTTVAGESNSFHFCCADYALPATQGNFNANPAFAGPMAGNFRLGPSSLCINAGTIQEWMINYNDLDGRSRIDRLTGKVDIGCYEYIFNGMMIRLR